MRTLILTAALIAMTFLFYGSSPQKESYVGEVIVFTECRGTQAIYDPLKVIETNKQYFLDKNIRIVIDSMEYKCGYELVKGSKAVFVEPEAAEEGIINICESFFFPRPRTCGT
jgi:hypothetical protein